MELLTLASDIGLINKGGAWYTLDFIDGDKIKLQGAEKVRQYLIDNPEHYIKLQKDVKGIMGSK